MAEQMAGWQGISGIDLGGQKINEAGEYIHASRLLSGGRGGGVLAYVGVWGMCPGQGAFFELPVLAQGVFFELPELALGYSFAPALVCFLLILRPFLDEFHHYFLISQQIASIIQTKYYRA